MFRSVRNRRRLILIFALLLACAMAFRLYLKKSGLP
jgi:hypothetical protein